MTEYANTDFWTQYRAYVQEVRIKHWTAVRGFVRDLRDIWSEWVPDTAKLVGGYYRPMVWLDLGCGQVGEATQLLSDIDSTYIGVDLDPPPVESFDSLGWRQSTERCPMKRTPNDEHRTVQHSYRDVEGLAEKLSGLDIDLSRISFLTSLFSSEITAGPEENRALYEKLFELCPNLNHCIVSGFYYSDRINENPVTEAGGLTSWQTNWRHGDYPSDTYSEIRFTQEVPSTLFGPNVVEVWRRLDRRPSTQENT